MSVESKIEGVKRLLARIRDYERMIESDDFEPATIDDMKANAKALCNAAKAGIDNIKAEIDSWE